MCSSWGGTITETIAGNLYSTGTLYEHCVAVTTAECCYYVLWLYHTVTRLYREGPICDTVTTVTYCSLLYHLCYQDGVDSGGWGDGGGWGGCGGCGGWWGLSYYVDELEMCHWAILIHFIAVVFYGVLWCATECYGSRNITVFINDTVALYSNI